MSGTKPGQFYFIAREFRGQRLYLAEFYTHGNGYRWVAEAHQAQRFEMAAAMPVVERASRDWGTACAVVDVKTGTLAQPKAAAALNGKETAIRERMIREAAKGGRQRVLRQAAARTASVSERHKPLCSCDHCQGLRGGAQS